MVHLLNAFPVAQAGNTSDTADNATDFIVNPSPTPQNTGSPFTPALPACLEISLTAPGTAEPGSSFQYTLPSATFPPSPSQGVLLNFQSLRPCLFGRRLINSTPKPPGH